MYTWIWEAEETSPFTGSVTVKIPKHQERAQLLKEMGFTVKDGKAELKDTLDASGVLYDFVKKNVEKVDLKRREDGMIFDKVEMLEYDVDGATVLTEIGTKLQAGVRLGKS